MKRFLILGWGGLLVLLGVALLAWIGYNVFVEMQPSAEGKSPVVPTVVAIGMILLGAVRIWAGLKKAHRGPATG